jgi:DNA replicative helicase MCM subunit Mcm2 (Cdc46/Mcm family)
MAAPGQSGALSGAGVVSPKRKVPLAACRALFASFWADHCLEELRSLLWRAGDEQAHHGVRCDVTLLLGTLPALCAALLEEPILVLPLAEDGLRDAQQAVLARNGCGPRPGWGNPAWWAQAPSLKGLVHARFDASSMACAGAPWLRVTRVRECHVNRLVALAGTCARQATSRVREAARSLTCTQCRFVFAVPLDAETGSMTAPPSSCPNPAGCAGSAFKAAATPGGLALNPALCVDAVDVVLAIPPQASGQREEGSPASGFGAAVTVVLEAELVNACAVGQDVTITGVVRRRWAGPPLSGGRSGADMVLYAVCVTPAIRRARGRAVAVGGSPGSPLGVFSTAFWARHVAHPLAGRELVVGSLCPQLRGLRGAKLAVMLALCGGSPAAEEGDDGEQAGSAIRGDIHTLLLGDPGCGKSQLLRAASQLGRRAVLAHGGHVTLAGLTAAVVRDAGGSALEAGALLRAHRGILVLDELDQLSTAARGALHEALEQRTLSFAKAGVQLRVPCAATLLAACNPKPGAPGGVRCPDLELATTLAAPLLSRFDLVVRIPDGVGAGEEAQCRDRVRAKAVLANRRAAIAGRQPHLPAGVEVAPLGTGEEADPLASDEAVAACLAADAPWPHALLARYIATVRDSLAPRLSPDAERLCSAFFRAARAGGGGGGPGRATPRLLEASLRLTRAHARLMGHPVASRQDACQALLLLRASMAAGGAEGGDVEEDGIPSPEALTAGAARDEAALCCELDAALGCGWRTGATSQGGQENREVQPPLALMPAPEVVPVAPTLPPPPEDDWGF